MEMIRSDTGRAGARTSILTEDQAVEVFLLRPAQRTDRAWLCAQLAERYHVTSTTIPAGLSTEIKLTSEAALPGCVGRVRVATTLERCAVVLKGKGARVGDPAFDDLEDVAVNGDGVETIAMAS